MEIVLPTIGKFDCSVSDGRFFLCNRECHTPEEHKSFLKELELIPDLEPVSYTHLTLPTTPYV